MDKSNPETIPLRVNNNSTDGTTYTSIDPDLNQGKNESETNTKQEVTNTHAIDKSRKGSDDQLSEQCTVDSFHGDIDSDVSIHQPPLAERIFRTVAIDAAYFCAALHLGIIGPSQLDLEALTHTNTSQISTIFTVRSVMAIIASFVFGPILDRCNRYVVVWLSLILSSVFTIAGPWSRSLPAVLLTLGPPEFFGCALGMGTHLLCIEIWSYKSGPFLQLLNFVSISGFTIAPLLVKPFLTETHPNHRPNYDDNTNNHMLNNHTSNAVDIIKPIIVPERNESVNMHYNGYNIINEPSSNSNGLKNFTPGVNGSYIIPEEDYAIYITYLIVGIYGFTISVLFLVIIIVDRKRRVYLDSKKASDEADKPEEKKVIHDFSKGQLYLMYFLFFWMILFYGGIEVAYPSQVTTFVNKKLLWRKSDGASLASVVMGSNAVFTALGIFLSSRIRPIILIWIDVVALLISLLILTLFIEKYPASIWLCSGLVGASSATIMPSAYTWANDLFEISGLFNSAFWCGFFSGFMISNLTGFLMHTLDYMWFCYTLLICGTMVVVMFAALTFIATRCSNKKCRLCCRICLRKILFC